MGACGAKESRSEAYKTEGQDGKMPRKTMTPEELRQSKARDSFRFNNRKGGPRKDDADSPTMVEVDEDDSQLKKHTRDSMVYNNRNASKKILELALVTPEEFVAGCRDVLRAPVLHDKIRAAVAGPGIPYEDVDMICVTMIPHDNMFKFYSQECLRHAFFTTCDGPSDITNEKAYENIKVPAAQVLCMLRNTFFMKRMQLCFDDEDIAAMTIAREKFMLACTQPESVYQNGDPGALYDRVASDHASSNGEIDWRYLVAGIADSFINSVALPSFN